MDPLRLTLVPLLAPRPLKATPTLADLLAVYEAEYLPQQALPTQRQKRGLFKVLRQEFGALPLEAVTPLLLRQWRDDLRTHLAPATVTRYLLVLSSVLRVAVTDLEWLTRNPMARVPKPTIPAERVRFLDAAEQMRLLDACQHSRCAALYPVVLLALTTGMRRAELLTLQWRNVDLAQGVVRLLITKTGRRRVVPIPHLTVVILREWQIRLGMVSLYVFPAHDGRKPASLMRAWYFARARAQLDDFRFHDLRHTAASYLAMSGVRLEVIAEILGHTSLATTRRYTHLLSSYTAEFVEAMSHKFIRVH